MIMEKVTVDQVQNYFEKKTSGIKHTMVLGKTGLVILS